eukprot:3119084-Amphidinium_carterae.2
MDSSWGKTAGTPDLPHFLLGSRAIADQHRLSGVDLYVGLGESLENTSVAVTKERSKVTAATRTSSSTYLRTST